MKFRLLLLPLLFSACCSCPEQEKEKFEYKRPNPTSLRYTDQPVIETKKTAAAVEVVDQANKGIGPVKDYSPAEINPDWASKGEELFKTYCAACHKIGKKFIGPDLKGLADRRHPAWALNMMLNPEQMIKEDPIAKQLLIDANGAPMAKQNITELQAKQLFDYIRSH